MRRQMGPAYPLSLHYRSLTPSAADAPARRQDLGNKCVGAILGAHRRGLIPSPATPARFHPSPPPRMGEHTFLATTTPPRSMRLAPTGRSIFETWGRWSTSERAGTSISFAFTFLPFLVPCLWMNLDLLLLGSNHPVFARSANSKVDSSLLWCSLDSINRCPSCGEAAPALLLPLSGPCSCRQGSSRALPTVAESNDVRWGCCVPAQNGAAALDAHALAARPPPLPLRRLRSPTALSACHRSLRGPLPCSRPLPHTGLRRFAHSRRVSTFSTTSMAALPAPLSATTSAYRLPLPDPLHFPSTICSRADIRFPIHAASPLHRPNQPICGTSLFLNPS
jgi:hypothetical protein